MTFGQKLKEIRKRFGLSQEQLAEIMNVSRQAITKWENDSGRVVLSRDSWRGDGSVDAPPSGYEGGTVVPQNFFIYFKILFACL